LEAISHPDLESGGWNAGARFAPFRAERLNAVEGLLWSPDGAYLLAATKADNFFTSLGVDVWNVKSGRHRGEFIGCPTNLTGLILFSGGRRLVSGCADGRIRIWDAESAIKQIAEFERSFTETK
jgi:WD40 repeat protein